MAEWSVLGNLATDALGAYASARKQRQEEEKRQSLADLATAGSAIDPRALGLAMLRAGDAQGALAAAALAGRREDRDWTRSKDVADLQLRTAEATRKDAPKIEEIYDPETGRKRKVTVSSAGIKPLGGLAEEKPATKPLPQNAVDKIGAAGSAYGDFARLKGEFKDEYGGWGSAMAGDLANTLARNVPLATDDARARADWWSDYQNQRNAKRHTLFGSALTATEKGEWEKSDINPGMDPRAIKKNLERQHAAATKAAQKIAGYHLRTGRDPDEIEAALGVPLDELGLKVPDTFKGRKAAAPAAAKPDAPSRFRELRSGGLSKEQAYAKLAEEGY